MRVADRTISATTSAVGPIAHFSTYVNHIPHFALWKQILEVSAVMCKVLGEVLRVAECGARQRINGAAVQAPATPLQPAPHGRTRPIPSSIHQTKLGGPVHESRSLDVVELVVVRE